MNFIIPNRDGRKWSQTNSSDSSGTLQRTRNMDFDLEGYAKLAKRSRSIYDITNGGRVLWIEYYQQTNKYWFMTLASGGIYSVNATTFATTDESGTSNVPAVDTTGGRNDATQWQGYLYATSTTTLRRMDSSGAWSLSLTGTSFSGISGAGYLAVHQRKNALGITQGNQVLLIDTSHTLLATLTVPAEFQATSLDYSDGYLILGTRNVNNGEAKVFRWSGNTSIAEYDYGVGSVRCVVRKYANTFIAINGLGQILPFNGGGFGQPLGTFPIFFREVDWDYDGSSYLGRIINRGVKVNGDQIYINVSPRILLPSADTAGHIFENWFEGGVWCYDPSVGLYHRYSHSSSLRVSNTIATSAVDISTDTITVSATAPVTGTPVIYCSDSSYGSSIGTAVGGLTNRTKYYIIYVTATTIKLATSYQNALDGIAINLTGTGNDAQVLIYAPNRDFGGSTLGGSGILVDAGSAITLVSNRENAYRTDAAEVIFGARLGKTSISGAYSLCVATFGQENRGYIQTPKLLSGNIVDSWQNITVKFRDVDTIEDKIVVKYRFIERTDTLTGIDQAHSQTATWVNTSKFTTTADISAAKIGDEVSFHSGSGSGYMAHIANISVSDGTYTVDLDEVIQNVTGDDTVGFIIENWNKFGTISTDDVDYFTNGNEDRYASGSGQKTFSILTGNKSKWLEVKAELRGEDVSIEEILVNNKPFKTFIN